MAILAFDVGTTFGRAWLVENGRILSASRERGGARDVAQGRQRGWVVDVVEAYRTRPVVPPSDVLADAATADAIAFTSASSVTAYVEAVGATRTPPVVVCIGPVTAEAAQRCGLAVAATAATSTLDGVVDALVQALGTVR